MEEEQAGDVSPLSMLFLASLFSSVVFLFLRKLYKNLPEETVGKPKFRRRTREEEERFVMAQLQARQAAEAEAPSDEEPDDGDQENQPNDELVGQEDLAESDGPRRLGKRDLHKLDKKKKKQERQEYLRYQQDRQKILRELREQEMDEKERLDEEQHREVAAKYDQHRATLRVVTEEQVVRVLSSLTHVTRAQLLGHFLQSDHEGVSKVLNRMFPSKQRHSFTTNTGTTFLLLGETIHRVEKEDLAALKASIRDAGGVMSYDNLWQLYEQQVCCS